MRPQGEVLIDLALFLWQHVEMLIVIVLMIALFVRLGNTNTLLAQFSKKK